MTSKLSRYIALIVLVGFLIYLPTLFFGFTYFDDNVLILRNYFFLKDFSNVFVAFGKDVFAALHAGAFYYRPLLTISFILDAQFSGTGPFFYHLTNVVFHLIASVLIFVTLVKLNYKKELAFLAGVIFSVHPVLTQAVAWIPGRNDSLLTVFLLSSFIFFLKYLEDKSWKSYGYHLFFFLLGTLTKESAMFLPVICFSYLILIKKEKIFSKSSQFLVLGWVGVLALWFLLRTFALKNPAPIDFSYAAASLFNNFPAVLLYLGKVLIPFNLSVLPTLRDSTLLFGIISLATITILLAISKKKRLNFVFFGTLWFLIFLVPNFIRPNSATVADFLEHRVYSALLGLFIVLSEIDFVKDLNLNNKLVKTLVVAIVLLLSTTTLVYTGNFKDKISFWTNAVATSPHHPLAHRNLGAMYYLDGKYDVAKIEFEKALELNPNEKMAHNNLGLVYFNKGDLKKAEDEYKKELMINPYYDDVHFNYGLLLYKEGKLKEAEGMWLKTLEINPDYIDAYKSLAVLYYQKKDFEKSNYYYNEALKRGAN